MAMDYQNFEIADKIKRNLKGSAPKDKLSTIEDQIQVVIPVTSANSPIQVRDYIMDFDSAPKNYITSNVAKDDNVATATYTTLNTITVPSGYYYFIWGITANVAATAGKLAIAAIATTEVTGLNDTSVLWASAGVPATGSAWVTLEAHFTRPIPLTTGTAYVRIYHEKGAGAQSQVAIRLEIRKIENRDP